MWDQKGYAAGPTVSLTLSGYRLVIRQIQNQSKAEWMATTDTVKYKCLLPGALSNKALNHVPVTCKVVRRAFKA